MAEGLSRSNSSFLPPASTGGKMVNIDHTNQNGWGPAPGPPEFNPFGSAGCALPEQRDHQGDEQRHRQVQGNADAHEVGETVAARTVDQRVRLVANGCREGARRCDHDRDHQGARVHAKRGPEADGNRRHDHCHRVVRHDLCQDCRQQEHRKDHIEG